ncbi:hypothetical protein LBMAG42_54040 [Deltaproteobacteria bacterium]|nr:hypothetical protein LBMAG42_54040 [Deltaproteobacteria bacterium]
MGFFLLLACGPDIRSLYEEERTHALTLASDVPADWQPDLVVAIGEEALGRAVTVAASEALESQSRPVNIELPLGANATLRPKLKVKSAVLSPGQGCESCVHFELDVRGDVSWSLGALGGSFPARLAVGGQLQVGVEDRTRVVARPFKIGKVELESGELGGLRANPSAALQDWVRAAVGTSLPPIPIADLGGGELPVRLLRVKTGEHALRVEVLTNVPGARAATVPDPSPEALILGLSETALSGLLRREAFEKGTVAMDVAVDPRAIDVEGNAFHLNLRLWRLVGSGWWRDYDVMGTLALNGGKIALKAGSVEETAASSGAELVDPLAALAQTQILEAIATNLERTLPGSAGEKVGGVKLRAVVTGVRGVGETLLVDAQLRVRASGE